MKKSQFRIVAAALAAFISTGAVANVITPSVAYAQEVTETETEIETEIETGTETETDLNADGDDEFDPERPGRETIPQTGAGMVNPEGSVIPGVDSEHPYSYVLITLDPTDDGTFEGETQFWVDPNQEVTIPANDPTGTDPTKPFVQWDKPLKQQFGVDTTIYAMYWEDVVAGHDTKHPDNYVEVILDPTDKFTPNGETNFWVNPTKEVTIPAQDPTPKDPNKHSFEKWDQPLTQKFETGTTITAEAKEWDPVIPVEPGTDPEETERPDGFVLITLDPTDKGTLEGSSLFWVNPDVEVTIPAGKVTPKKDDEPFTRWDKELTGQFTEATTIHAQYGQTGKVAPNTGIATVGLAGAGIASAVAGAAAYLSRKKKED